MKPTIPLLFTALSIGTAATAQWTTDVSVNTVVRADASADINTPLIADGPDGSTYSCWFENGTGAYQLRMQRLDVDGNRMWPDSGLVVSAFPQNSAIYRYDMKSDRSGNAVVAFQDERTGALDIVAYKIAPDGSFLWGADGVELPTPGTTGLGPSVAPLSNGNTAIAWSTNSLPGQVAFQLVDPVGNLLLTTPHQLSAATRLSRPVPVATSDGGFILQYELEGASFLTPATMFAQRFDDAGNTVWPAAITVSTKTISGFYFPAPIADGLDGFYLAFNTSNPVNPSLDDVYAQRVRGNGTSWSAEGTQLDNSSTTQKFTAGKGLVLVNDQSGLMVPMQVTDGGQGQSGVSVQRIDTAGVRQLGDVAVPVLPVTAVYYYPNDIAATSDGAVILDYTGAFGQVHIAATLVDLAGVSVWAPAQRDICTANSNKDDVQLSGVRNGQCVAVWQDDRTPNGVYAQNIPDLNPTAIGNADIANYGVVRLESNPANVPVLLFAPGTKGIARIEVYDVQGKLVYGIKLSAFNRVQLPLGGLSPGIYTIRVLGKSMTGTVRWVK